MASLEMVARFLNKELRNSRIRDISRNGLQVRGRKTVKKIGFAVDACSSVFEKAGKLGCDLVITHHGLLWKRGLDPDAALLKKRVACIRKLGLSLFVSHLPLDAHETYGNNAQFAKLFDSSAAGGMAEHDGVPLGRVITLRKAMTPRRIAALLDRKLKTRCVVLDFGKPRVRRLGLVTGGGRSADLTEARALKLDCLVLGEASYRMHNAAKDSGMNVILAGHYHTETLGVQALMPLVRERFRIKTVFIDNPTRL